MKQNRHLGRMLMLCAAAVCTTGAGLAQVSDNDKVIQKVVTLPAVVDPVMDSDLNRQAEELHARFKEIASGSRQLSTDPKAKWNELSRASDVIEGLAGHGAYTKAQQLSDQKLAAVQRSYGKYSGAVLDALQDKIFLASQQRNGEQAKTLLNEYAAVALQLRQTRRGDEVDEAEKTRSDRLNGKLQTAVKVLFKPL